ncbi:MAG: hypothetical protein HY817_01815 [Candidatus Abawacabacteria bacterium]|nr:hypothetical protein [Candidatus Abawacabacteria bacterium]
METVRIRDKKTFSILPAEQQYCEQRRIPLAQVTPLEGFREMFAFRNETTLFNRICDKSGRDIISIHRPNTAFPVYAQDIWLSEDNDPLQYGRPYDFTKPFFQQFFELSNTVPREAQLTLNAENSPYVNINVNVKDCYFTFNCLNSQECMYGNKVYSSRDCIDNIYISNCELCYECINCHGCYDLKWAQHSFNCRNSLFLYGCRNCSDCFGCVGLEHKQFCLWNQQYTPEEYKTRIAKLFTGKWSELVTLQQQFVELIASSGYVYNSNVNNVDCTGEYIDNCKDCTNSFITKNSDHVSDSFNMQNCKDCMRSSFIFDGQFIYRSFAMSKGPYNCQFCYMSPGLAESQYCAYVFHSEKMFGCIGFPRRSAYCILNKQYSKEEYENLLPRIITHMKTTGEWGQWFPLWMSDFPYNDTLAQEYFPLTPEQAQLITARWNTNKHYPVTEKVNTIPDDIHSVTDRILDEVLQDHTNKRAYKLQRKELEFYREHTIPIPRECFDSRNLRRSKALIAFQ